MRNEGQRICVLLSLSAVSKASTQLNSLLCLVRKHVKKVFTCVYEQYKKLVFTILLVAEVDYTSFIHWYLLYSCEFSNSTGCCRMIDVFLYQCNIAE